MANAKDLNKLTLCDLNGLELSDFYLLKDQCDDLWKKGISKIPNEIYDKLIDAINYEMKQLTDDSYNYTLQKTDDELDKLLNYFNQAHRVNQPLISNAVWDILSREQELRRINGSISNVVRPSFWTLASTEMPFQLVTLSKSTNEYRELVNYFTKSLGKRSTVVFSIKRIENLRLLYEFKKLEKLYPNTSQRLIHGTPTMASQSMICRFGFRDRFCPGGSIGDGVYFAVHASYSDAASYVLKATAHRRELFICQVLLGRSGQGKFMMNSLTAHSLGYQSLYHNSDPHINDQFCIFNHYQAYPEYIIQYDYQTV